MFETILRLHRFNKKKGLVSTAREMVHRIARSLWKNRDVIFIMPCKHLPFSDRQIPAGYSLLSINSFEALSPSVAAVIESVGVHSIIHKNIKRRFASGARLWLLEHQEVPIGFVWSLVGKTLSPYYFPLQSNDVHLFDNEIFEQFRGKGHNSILIQQVSLRLSAEGADHLFIETGVWNKSELRSLIKNGFITIGIARKKKVRGKIVVIWEKATPSTTT
jgi:ribosomal protein S18 acetylase RimI-like enzyme